MWRLQEIGREEGKIQLLTELIETKFGPQSPEIRKQIQQAAPSQISRWTKNIFTANSIEELLR